MSGFVAVIAIEPGITVDPAEVAGLADVYEQLRGAGTRANVEVDDWAGAVKIDTRAAEQAGIERSDSGWALHAGAVYGPRPLATAEPGDLDGLFAILRRANAASNVSLVVDPFGMQTVYLARRGGLAYVSTSALCLARHLRAATDPAIVLRFLRAGTNFGAETYWPEIRRLEPATEVTLGPGLFAEHTYWRPDVDARVRALAFDQAVEHVIEAATVALAPMRARPTSWADLTGGFDTRLMNLLLARSGVSFETQTRETRRRSDLRIARTVARAAGWPWRSFHVPDTWPSELPNLVRVALGWSDGQLDALQLARNLYAHREASDIHRALFVGIGGDHLRGHAWRQEFYREGRSNRVNWDNLLDMRLLHPIDTSIFASDPTALVRESLGGLVREWTAPYRDELNTVQLDMIHAFKMTGHAGAFCSADGAFLRAQLPFYTRAIFAAAISTNFRYRNNHRLMRHMIERLDSRVAAVETDTGGPAQAWRLSNLHRFAPYYLKLGRKALNKVGHRALGRELLPERLPLAGTMGEAVAGFVDALALDPRSMRSGGLYAAPNLRRLIADATDGRFADLGLLGRILTIEHAMRAANTDLD